MFMIALQCASYTVVGVFHPGPDYPVGISFPMVNNDAIVGGGSAGGLYAGGGLGGGGVR